MGVAAVLEQDAAKLGQGSNPSHAQGDQRFFLAVGEAKHLHNWPCL